MLIEAKDFQGVLIDADTRQPIRAARWANLATGEYERLACGIDGKPLVPAQAIRGKVRRLEFLPLKRRRTPRAPSAVDAKAAAEELAEYRRKISPRLLVPGEYCEARGCNALACWHVSWERLLQPIMGPEGKLQERAVTESVHSYCPRHYHLPRQKSVRGVESEVEVGVRPQ